MFSFTLFLMVCLRVTGIVAAEDCVPNAVKYAGSIVTSSLNGFLLVTIPATENWRISTTMCNAKIIPMIWINTVIMLIICPDCVMFKNIPNICHGSNGIITYFIDIEIISLNSLSMSFRLSPNILLIPNPNKNAKNNAVITDIKGGMEMEK